MTFDDQKRLQQRAPQTPLTDAEQAFQGVLDASFMKPCPKCGRAMAESPKFKGLWMCPGYQTPLNAAPPFRYECEGMELTLEGARAFRETLDDEFWKRKAKEN